MLPTDNMLVFLQRTRPCFSLGFAESGLLMMRMRMLDLGLCHPELLRGQVILGIYQCACTWSSSCFRGLLLLRHCMIVVISLLEEWQCQKPMWPVALGPVHWTCALTQMMILEVWSLTFVFMLAYVCAYNMDTAGVSDTCVSRTLPLHVFTCESSGYMFKYGFHSILVGGSSFATWGVGNCRNSLQFMEHC